MTATFLISFYGIVCILMIVFNLCYLRWERVRTKRMDRRCERMGDELKREIARNLAFPSEDHRRMLERRLRRLTDLESFDLTMEQLATADPAAFERYLGGISSIFDHLAPRFSGKNELRRAYFDSLVRRWYRARPAGSAVMDKLIADLSSHALSTRQNALEALVEVASPEQITQALNVIDRAPVLHSTRLIAEALMAFPGDSELLNDEIHRAFPGFSDRIKVAIAGYLRLSDARRGAASAEQRARAKRILAVAEDESTPKELKLACMRYFMSNPCEGARGMLMQAAGETRASRWEIPVVATQALGSYPGDDTVQTLRRCLTSPIYHVRYNAAASLRQLGVRKADLADIIEGDDRYAKEMVLYHWADEGESASAAREGGAS